MTDDPGKAGENEDRDRKGRWRKGQSGNPHGYNKGSRHRATLAAEALLDGEAEKLTRKAVELAMGGDCVALRLCMERILPPRKERPIEVALPEIEGAASLTEVTATLITASATGTIAPGEAEALAKLVEAHRKTVELVELERRVKQLEESNK